MTSITNKNHFPSTFSSTQNLTSEKELSSKTSKLVNYIFNFRFKVSFIEWKNTYSSSLFLCVLKSITINLLGDIKNGITNAINRIFKRTVYSNSNKLIKGYKVIDSSQNAWFINLALMRQIAETSKLSPEQIEQIQFLASNYLHKSAPIHIGTMSLFFKQIKPLFQVNGLTYNNDYYHRFSLQRPIHLSKIINENLALRNNSPLILTDTIEFQHLLPLKFHVTQDKSPNSEWILNELIKHFSTTNIENALKNRLSTPFLFDLTSTLGKNIKTNKDAQKELLFKRQLNTFTSELNTAITRAVNALILQKPTLAKHRSKLIKFVKTHTTCICRTEVDNVAGIKVLPLFSNIQGSKVLKVHSDFTDFIVATGIGMGAINLRRKMLNSINYRKDIHYAVKPKEAPYFAKYSKKEFIDSAFYQRLAATFDSLVLKMPLDFRKIGISRKDFESRKAELTNKPHLTLLGKATFDLLTGILNEIDDTQWEKIHSHPVYSQIMQTSLYKIREFLSTAELSLNNSTEFAQQIELVHCELATILEIVRPYEESEFENIYKTSLQPNIPQNLYKHLKVGLGKTSVNICAGINEAIRQIKQTPYCVYSENFYFEQAAFIGYKNQFEQAMKDDATPKIDLYFGQFNPNIEIASDFTNYKRQDIAKDTLALLNSGKASDSLTIAVDCTIDKYDSQNIKSLLQQFEKEIEEGKLNFIFFHSGQKFDMLGMDNYYGSPFYMVNNNSEKWKSFNSITTKKVHQTDALSNQWFCLSNQYAKDSLAQYRKLIFNNTRYILDRIPEKLKPQNPINLSQKIRVNTANEDIDACFIDIKVLGSNHKAKSIKLLGKFYQKMISKGIKIQTRATFGLYHPNALIISINEVEGSTSIRLHPGLNPEENAAFIEYFEELAK